MSIDSKTIRDLLSGKLEQELENILNQPAPPYNEAMYWNERYVRHPEPFEWFQPWTAFKGAVLPLIPGRKKAIDIGCGNSPMTSDLLKDGFEKVVGFDISSVVIESNRKKFSDEKRLEWVIGNVLNLSTFEAESFDAVFDKGTFDCLATTGLSNLQVSQFFTNIFRILKPGGVFVEISFGTPKTRQMFVNNSIEGWKNVLNQEIEKKNDRGNYHYVYCLQKDAEEE
ncbi:Menaquinone biosynthesis methyltransferase [Tritrichomonas foetus]|uniref:Menaquinone biosynthesis methyltransferase n=1 Tax=Tritrichomonas foetus TaxID=1144522 RepID=A0A1J4K2R3_9EUKA|nr:Menaquinone biosynthesis methyltransferase [Tritrichomonas foetus]|eukprot:OHT03781.1 Menaquinone biosynthesis methyltransferase [Tritrichomonas foetus]